MYNCILLRYGEVGIKSKKKRPYFEKLYISSIKEALKKNALSGTIINLGGRFVIKTDQTDDVCEVLKTIPGIQSFSPAIRFEFSSKNDLLLQARDLAKDWVHEKTFRVTASRAGSHEFSSMRIAGDLGEQLLLFSKGVSLQKPQITIYLEVRNNEAFLYTQIYTGLDGMPAASSGKVASLFSGGLDSPVAAFKMLKRGCALDYIFINLLGPTSFEQVAPVYNYLVQTYHYNQTPRFIHVDGTSLVKEIEKTVKPSLRQLALKIVFYKIAEHFQEIHSYNAIVTGESLAQKSSQTFPSLNLIQSQSNAFIARPLLAMDKLEIIKIAKSIGTYGASHLVKEHCDLAHGHLVTAIPVKEDLFKIPDFSHLITQAVKDAELYKGIIQTTKEFLQEIPQDVVCVDIRLTSLAKHNPLKTDKHIYFYDALDALNSLDKKKNYLFVCEQGVQSAALAYECRKKGIRAFSMSVKEFLKRP